MDGSGGNFAGVGSTMPAGPEAWYRLLPPVTRAIATATFILTLLSSLGMLPVELLMLDWRLAVFRLQFWRFATTILYIGKFSLGWVFHMYMWTQVSSDLENNGVFRQASKGAYLFFILLVTFITSVLSLVVFWPSGGPDLLTQAPKFLDMAAACVSNAPPPQGGGGGPGAPRMRTTGAPGTGAAAHSGGGPWGLRPRGTGAGIQPFTGRGYTLGSESHR
ncbi:hypothetical protein Emag_006722 [Eimeria magna]